MKTIRRGGPSSIDSNFEEDVSAFDYETDEEVLFARDGICSACGLAATTRCNGCLEAPRLADCNRTINGAWYCSKTCQKERWPKHKKPCKELQQRIQVSHAGGFLKNLWLILRRFAWDLDFKSIRQNGKHVKMFAGNAAEIMRKRFLRPFPESLTSKSSLMLYSSIGHAQTPLFGYAFPFKAFFMECSWRGFRPNLGTGFGSGRYTKLELIGSSARNQMLRPVVVDDKDSVHSNNSGAHLVWKVTMTSGEKWAIDPTGSQYGWHESTMSWSSWCKERSTGAEPINPRYANFEAMIMICLNDVFFDLFN